MPVEDLWPPVSVVPVFADELRESIKEKGLMNPIIVVRLPQEDIAKHFEAVNFASKRGPGYLPDTPVINVIWGGSNRLEAVKQLGYTHVDCVLIPDFFAAMEVQNLQRNAYKKGKASATGKER